MALKKPPRVGDILLCRVSSLKSRKYGRIRVVVSKEEFSKYYPYALDYMYTNVVYSKIPNTDEYIRGNYADYDLITSFYGDLEKILQLEE